MTLMGWDHDHYCYPPGTVVFPYLKMLAIDIHAKWLVVILRVIIKQ